MTRPRLAVLMSFSGEGGVERMVMNLVREFATRDIDVDLLPIRADSAHLDDIPDQVRCIDLGARHSSTVALPLAAYLRRERPKAVLAAKDRAGRAALLARSLAGVDTRIVVRLGTNLSAALEGKSAWRRWSRIAPMRRRYRDVDAIVAVSRGVADDTRAITGLPADRLHVIRNPVITDRLSAAAAEPVQHPWLDGPRELPVILGAGRLTHQKGFDVLISAFAGLQHTHPSRLLILGEGKLRDTLLAQAARLGVAERVDLPGFDKNPWRWMRAADLFVLSSRWEGSPNVLTEAMALGTPVVACDCPSGPREILDGGRVAPLVPVDDVTALTAALASGLDTPATPEALAEAVKEYRSDISAGLYLDLLGLGSG